MICLLFHLSSLFVSHSVVSDALCIIFYLSALSAVLSNSVLLFYSVQDCAILLDSVTVSSVLSYLTVFNMKPSRCLLNLLVQQKQQRLQSVQVAFSPVETL